MVSKKAVRNKRYAIDQCALYKVTSPDMLAERLLVSRATLDKLVKSDDNYLRFEKDGRAIQEPKPQLKGIQRRIAGLLSRIETPDYLHSAIRRRSYISNARPHSADSPTIKLDIKKFFPSARAQAIYHFFLDDLKCSGDVAGILTRLLTIDGHLPTGGNASSILSFFAYRRMFDELASLMSASGSAFTTYVDDMTATGPSIGRATILAARRIVGSFRLRAHKGHHFGALKPKIITGVAVTRRGQQLPNRRQKLIAEGFDALSAAKSDKERLDILRKLVSRVHEAAEVDARWQSRATSIVAHRRGIAARNR